jgi:hypothetical protein
MQNSGWEMRTAGWILVVATLAVFAYFINQWLQRRSSANPEEQS